MSIFSTILEKIFHGAPIATAAASSATPAPSQPAVSSSAAAPVNVESVLSALAEKRHEKLNWKTSIVDLLKLLDLDSSLAARQSLASELHYSGSSEDSASMNIWLSKQVMTKLAENGGNVPAELKH